MWKESVLKNDVGFDVYHVRDAMTTLTGRQRMTGSPLRVWSQIWSKEKESFFEIE